MKNRITGIFLLFCLIIPTVGTYAWLYHEKSAVRKQVKRWIIAGLDKKELVRLKFSAEEIRTKLRWEHAGEFEYDNQMYDIVGTGMEGDSITYWCWPDHDESRLNRQLNELAAFAFGNDPKSKQQQECLTDYFKSLYHSKAPAWHTLLHQSRQAVHPCAWTYLSVTFPPPVPPPKAC